jgi:hypothetical protein
MAGLTEAPLSSLPVTERTPALRPQGSNAPLILTTFKPGRAVR